MKFTQINEGYDEFVQGKNNCFFLQGPRNQKYWKFYNLYTVSTKIIVTPDTIFMDNLKEFNFFIYTMYLIAMIHEN